MKWEHWPEMSYYYHCYYYYYYYYYYYIIIMIIIIKAIAIYNGFQGVKVDPICDNIHIYFHLFQCLEAATGVVL